MREPVSFLVGFSSLPKGQNPLPSTPARSISAAVPVVTPPVARAKNPVTPAANKVNDGLNEPHVIPQASQTAKNKALAVQALEPPVHQRLAIWVVVHMRMAVRSRL